MSLQLADIQKLQNELFKEVVRVCDKNKITYYGAYGTALGAIRHKGMIPWDGDVDIYVPENEMELFLNAMEKDLDPRYWVDFRSNIKTYRDFPRVGYRGYDTGVLHVDVFRLAGAPSEVKKQKRLRRITGLIHNINDVKEKGFKSYLLKKYKVKQAFIVTVLTAIFPLRKTVKWIDFYSKKYPFEKSEYVGNSVSGTYLSIFPKKLLGNGAIVPYEDFSIRVPEYYNEYLKIQYGNYMEFPPESERNKVLNRVYHTRINPVNGLKSIYHEE